MLVRGRGAGPPPTAPLVPLFSGHWLLLGVCVGGREGVAGALNGVLGIPRWLSRHSSALQWLTLLSGDSKELEFMSLPHTPCSELGEWLICLSAA